MGVLPPLHPTKTAAEYGIALLTCGMLLPNFARTLRTLVL
jgi:hypothetical protein